MSVPACDNKFGQRFVFPSVASLATPDSDDDEHPYENMAAVMQEHKSRQPPKVSIYKNIIGEWGSTETVGEVQRLWMK